MFKGLSGKELTLSNTFTSFLLFTTNKQFSYRFNGKTSVFLLSDVCFWLKAALAQISPWHLRQKHLYSWDGLSSMKS